MTYPSYTLSDRYCYVDYRNEVQSSSCLHSMVIHLLKEPTVDAHPNPSPTGATVYTQVFVASFESACAP